MGSIEASGGDDAAGDGSVILTVPVEAADQEAVSAGRPEPVHPGLASHCRHLLRTHALFGSFLLLGVVARVLVVAAYPPALMYMGDSGAYLDQAWRDLWPGDWRPSGYPIFLRLLDGPQHITRIVLVQHLLTVLVAVGLYAAALRAVRRPWLAAFGAAPALLAPWVLDLGQFVLADCLFGVLVTAGVVALALPARPDRRPGPEPGAASGASVGAWSGAVAGLLLGAALCVRTVGYGPLALAVAALVIDAARRPSARRDLSARGDTSGEDESAGAGVPGRPGRGGGDAGGRWCAFRGTRMASASASAMAMAMAMARRYVPAGAFVLAAAVPVGAYAGWSASEGQGFTVSAHSGFFLYGRVAPFADCDDVTGADLRSLCDPRPVGQRGAPVRYLWPADSPLRQDHRRIPAGREDLAGTFAHDVVRRQPLMLITSSARYLAGYLSPLRYETVKTSRADTWELPTDRTNALPPSDPHADDGYFVATDVRGPAHLLAAWSRVSYPPMPLVGVGLLAGLAAAAVGLARGLRARRLARGGGGGGGGGGGPAERVGPGRLFWLAAGSGVSTLVLSAFTSGFDYRYLGAVIGPIGMAAVLGVAALARAVRHRPAA